MGAGYICEDVMTDDLKLPQVGELTLPRWQYWLARYNKVLSDRERRIERLEAALREISDGPRNADKSYVSLFHEIQSQARKALEETK
jgi:hypothetical protein